MLIFKYRKCADHYAMCFKHEPNAVSWYLRIVLCANLDGSQEEW